MTNSPDYPLASEQGTANLTGPQDTVVADSASKAAESAIVPDEKLNFRRIPPSPMDDWTPDQGYLLDVQNLHLEFRTRDGVAKAINGVSFHLDQGESLAILGESGSGKSVTAQAIMGILDSPPSFITDGRINFRGVDLLSLNDEDRRHVRGRRISMIFQDALSALNPVFTVGWQIAEMYRQHWGLNKADAEKRAVRLMERVNIPAARQRANNFPHQFSGGMRQRIMIAMALALDPEIVIADEPTTALDVTVQAQIMELLKNLQAETGMGLILITHDLGVVADVADRINVMYAGRMVEAAGVRELYANPAHPYTKGLLDSIPRLDQTEGELAAIGGLPPNLTRIPAGCAFNPRCRYTRDVCLSDPVPVVVDLGDERKSACHFTRELLAGTLEPNEEADHE